MHQKYALVGLVWLGTLLTGCAGDSLLEVDPRCPFKERGGCYSIKEIHQMIDANQHTPDGDYVAKPHPVRRGAVQSKMMRVYVPSQGKSGLHPGTTLHVERINGGFTQ